jgi:hypothetical protein
MPRDGRSQGYSAVMNQMNRNSGAPGAEPSQMPRVEPGGVPPGETPPCEDSMSEATPQLEYQRARGWAKGPLIAIMILVVLVAAFFLAYAITLMV